MEPGHSYQVHSTGFAHDMAGVHPCAVVSYPCGGQPGWLSSTTNIDKNVEERLRLVPNLPQSRAILADVTQTIQIGKRPTLTGTYPASLSLTRRRLPMSLPARRCEACREEIFRESHPK